MLVSVICLGDWKLLEFLEDNYVELYNLKEDIGEKNNLEKVNFEKVKVFLYVLSEWC